MQMFEEPTLYLQKSNTFSLCNLITGIATERYIEEKLSFYCNLRIILGLNTRVLDLNIQDLEVFSLFFFSSITGYIFRCFKV